MGKWKRSGADALREYENTTNYAYNQGGNTLTQGKKASRSGLDALTEYEQGGGLERAYENYKAAVLEWQKRQREQAALAQNQQTKRYQQQTEARKTEMQNYAASGASSAAKNTAYENYKYALMQQELLQKQQSGKVLTAAEKNILNSVKYKNPAVQEQNDQTNQKIAQATVEKVKASDVLTKQEYFKDAQVAGENGTYKDYMQRQYDSASIEAMQEQSDTLAAQIAEQEQKIRDRQTAMGEVTGEESQARQEEMKRKIASGELESTGEMETQLAALQQEKALLDQKQALKRGDVALGALDEETLGLLDEYVHGSSAYVREHTKGYNQQGQSKKSARQDLIAKGYTEDEIKKLAEFYERREDYESATAEYAEMQELAADASGAGKAVLSAATALGTPFKALGNIESVRGVLPSWLGGYQNEDMPTNIYSGLYRPVRVSSAIRSGTMADMGATGQFLYQAGMSALDSAVNMGVSVGLVGAAGLSGSAAQSAVASTMNWVMGSQVAADSVYEGIQSGKSNSDALIDGIVEGAIEGITEKYSVGDIIENLLSGKAVWRKIVRAFASEGAEEVASNWLNRLYDVTLRHDRSEILQTFNAYLKQDMSEKEALTKTLEDFAKEDGLSFLAGGLSGLAMSGTYRAFGDLSTEANVQSAAAWAIENGRVQDVIDIGLAQGEGKAYVQAAKMQEKVDVGQMPTQGEAASILREYAKAQRERAEDAQGGKPEQKDKTYQTYKNAVQEAERAQAAFEAAQQGKDLYDEQGRLVGQSDARTEIYAAEEEGELTREEADAALNALDAERNATQPEQEETQRHKDAMTARGRLTAQRERAEEEFERTALEQEKAAVKKAAEDQGLPRQYANTAMMGYTAYKSAGGEMSAAEYAGAVTGAYQAGMDGRSLNAARSAAEDVQGKIIDAVWNAGKRAAGAGEVQKNNREAKTNETGKAAADDGGKRNGGMDSGKQSGRMAEDTGAITEKSEKRRAAEERIELENRVGAAGQPYLSGKEIGIANGSTEKTLREVPKSAYTQSLQDAEAELRQAGVGNVHFFIGRIGVVNQASQVRRFAEGAATGGEVWVRADSRTFTAAQLARHEAFHVMAEEKPALLETVRQQIASVLSEEEIRTLAKRYAEAYAGCYTENELELYIAEICADAYAGMARFGEVSQRTAQAVAQQQSRAQNVQKNSSPRGPPQTRYSISETENSSRAETQREITKRYRQTVHEILNGKKNVDGALLVGYTPEVYQKLGMPDLPFVVGSGHVYSMAKTAVEAAADGKRRNGVNYHGLGESVVADIMEFVKDPVMVIAAKDVDANTTPMRSTHSVVALIDVGIGKNSLVIPVAITAERTVDGVRMDVNAISSAYEKDTTALVNEAIAQFNAGENSVFYVKKEAANLLGAGVQFPERLEAAASSDGIVRKFDSKINMSVKNVTESQQFKRWFGDWQNHPERASKVVNADGTPKVMYHGTSAEFTVFDRSQGKKKVHLNVLGEGNYFTARQSAAARYGNNVMEAYLDIKNPYVFDTHSYNTVADQYAAEFGVERSTFTGRDVARMLQARGYDGVVGYDADGEVVIANAFTSNRIKSATDNAGTFDRSNPDIRFSVSMEQETDTGEAVQATEQQAKKKPRQELTLDTIPKKAQNYLRGAERNLLYQLERNLRMPLGQSVKEIRTELDGLVNTYLKTGGISERTTQETFERVWDKAMEAERALYEKTRPAAETLRRMELTLTEAEKAAIGDYAAFEKRMRGKVRVGEAGGVSLDEVYRRMRKAVPELFPNVIAPAETEQSAEGNSTEETKKSSKASKAERQEMFLLMGINRMDQIAAQVESADGENAEVWKARAKNDFSVCVRDMVADLRIARRYAEAAMREKEAQNAPRTVDEAMELYHTAANQLRDYEREARKWLLTKEDQKIVNMLLRGDITEKSVREKPNAEAILAIYAAKADYDVTMLKIAEWNKTIAEQRVKRARAALGDVQNYKDKKYGIQYQRETQKRNVYDIAPEENAEKINREYFEPVRHASAEAVRLKNRMRERVTALGISRKKAKGDKISEAAAVQIVGEAQDNIRAIENSRGRIEARDGKTLEEWEALLQDLWIENPSLQKERIQNAVKEFRKIYDELYGMMNEVRVRNGYAPMNYRAGYFPHFQAGASDGILNLMGKAVGLDAGVEVLPNDAKGILKWIWKEKKAARETDALPTEINGRTRGFKPGITWFGNAQERTGYQTAFDAVEGFDRYIEGASSVICFTDAIRNLRALAGQVRYLSGSQGIREQEDAIRAREDLTEEQKADEIEKIRKDGKYALSRWAANLDEYTNLLANKKSEFDRGMESMLNRSVHSFLKKWQSRVAANMVALNPGSWLTNFGVITQAGAQLKTTSVLKAMYQQTANAWVNDNFAERSDFLTARAGDDALVSNWANSASATLGKPMEWIDWWSSNVIVRARYMENLERGMTEENAMQEADSFAADVMADRSKGAMPTLFESRNPLAKMFTQFQLEVNNTFSYVLKDLPREQRKKGVAAIAMALIKFCIGGWLYNELYEALVGRRPMLDPIDLVMEGVGEIAGYDRNNLILAALEGEAVFEQKDENGNWLGALASMGGELGQELPFVGNLLGGGKLPYLSTFPDIGNLYNTVRSETLTGQQKLAKVWKELESPAAYWLLPFGGGQAKKIVQGMEAVARGGSYTVDTEGRDKLQYPVYNQTKADTVKSLTQALLFGKTATEEAQSWVESGFQSLSADETAAYQSITEYEDQRSTYDFIRAMKNVKLTADKKMLLGSYEGVSEEAKAEYYYQVMATEKQQADMAGMSTAERIEYVNGKIQEAQSDKLKDSIREGFEDGTISEEKAIQKLVANDFAEDADEAYWKVDEWKRGDAGVYDEILAEVDAGGDVKKAAQRYLDNGKKASDIASSITSAYKQRYIAADAAERKRLKALLLDAYAALGYDRKEKSKDIDAWLKAE